MKKNSLIIIASIIFTIIVSCKQETYFQGRLLYEDYCQNCHMEDGTGLRGIIPPLKGSDFLKNNQHSLVCLIRKGSQGGLTINGRKYSQPMPGNANLTQGDIANIINYINHAWDNNYGVILYDDVLKQFETCR